MSPEVLNESSKDGNLDDENRDLIRELNCYLDMLWNCEQPGIKGSVLPRAPGVWHDLFDQKMDIFEHRETLMREELQRGSC